nr:EOG090X07CE [Eulimnadia texana]
MANHYDIPSWAAKPPTGLHLDVLKDGKLVQKLLMDQKKCYLFGRNPQMNDFCIDHASCSRVHAALVWHKHLQRAFLVDLGSTHGTFIGSLRIESHKPTQLPIDSIFHFGASTREYVIRERPQTTSRSILEELEEESKTEHQDGGLLGLPESEIELQNLTEFNTAHNRRITMLGIADEDARAGPRKRKKHNVSFKDEEDIINPEDVDPSVGRFRNLIQTTVIPVKKMKANTGDALTPESRRQRTNSASSDEETKSHTGHSSLLFASSLCRRQNYTLASSTNTNPKRRSTPKKPGPAKTNLLCLCSRTGLLLFHVLPELSWTSSECHGDSASRIVNKAASLDSVLDEASLTSSKIKYTHEQKKLRFSFPSLLH